MGFEDLTHLQFLQGTFSLIWVIIATIVGIRIILKAKINKNYIVLGLCLILMAGAYWASSMQFLFYGLADIVFTDDIYLLLTNIAIPWGMICWLWAFGVFAYPDIKKKLVLIYLIIVIVYQLLFIILLYSPMSNLIGTKSALMEARFGAVALGFMMFGLVTILVTGLIFARKSMKLGDPKVKWQGIFLMLAWIAFGTGMISDAVIRDPTELITVLTRLVLISCAVWFYLAFFLPDSLAKRLTKE